MQVKDPTEWFDDLSVHIDDEELIEQAAALEPTLLHGGSRIGAAVWIILVSAIAGAFGGFTFSDEVRSSWLIFVPYLIGGALLLRVLKPLSTRLLGPTVAWQAALRLLLVISSGDGGGVGEPDRHGLAPLHGERWGRPVYWTDVWLAQSRASSAKEDAWLLAALPLGALSTWSATALQRAFDASANPPWSEAFVGTMAASVFMVPMAVLMAMLSSKSNGLAKMATLYLHNENFTAKAIEYLDEAIALSPRSADLYNLRGIAHSKVGRRRSCRCGLSESDRAFCRALRKRT